MGNVRVNSDLQLTGELRAPQDRRRPRHHHRPDQPRSDPGACRRARRTPRNRPSTHDRPSAPPADRRRAAASAFPHGSLIEALQMDVQLTVPNDLVVKASDLQSAGRADRPRRAERDARRRSLRRARTPYDQIARLRHRQHRPRHLRLPGPAVHDSPRRHHPLRRASTSSIRRSTSGPSGVIQGVEAQRQRPRHAEAAGDRPDQHAAARAGRHPVADRLQPADQSARRRAADLAGAAGAGAGDRRRRRRSWRSRSATR